MFYDRLTPEDHAVFVRAASRNRESLPADSMVMLGDSRDYLLMRGREEWRARPQSAALRFMTRPERFWLVDSARLPF